MQTTPATRTIRIRPRQAARCAGSKAQPPQVGTTAPVTDGFLKHGFTPMYQPAQDMPKKSTTERGFFKSLSYLDRHYGLNLTNFRTLPYPYNILMAEREAARKLKKSGRHRELKIVEQEDKQVCLAVNESFSHDFFLYYIPVMPIYDLWQSPQQVHCAKLLTAVCAYLYAEAGIDYYRDDDSYMYGNYEWLEEWIADRELNAEDEDDYCRQREEYENAKVQGDFIQEKMMAKGFRQSLDSLIANFEATTEYEKNCLKIARTTWELWQAFPGTSLYGNANLPNYDPDDYDDNYISMHEYFSFVGSVEDSTIDDLKNMVNDDFNERSRYQEPEIITCFNQPGTAYIDELAYEEKLINLIDDLCNLLYQRP